MKTDSLNKGRALSEYETLSKRRIEIENQRVELHDEAAPLKKQLSEMIMRNKGRKYGHVDPKTCADLQARVSFIDAELRMINIEENRINRRLGELRRENARQNAPKEREMRKTKLGLFHSVARELLPEETFLRIWNVVEGRVRAAGEIIDDETDQVIAFETDGNK